MENKIIVSNLWTDNLEKFWKSNNTFASDWKLQQEKINSYNYNLLNLNVNLGKDIHISFLNNENIVGCGSLFFKKYEHLLIGGIGRIAVDHKFRWNNISTIMMCNLISIMFMKRCDISILWASTLKAYERVGYFAIYKNMMFLPIKKQFHSSMLLNLKEIPERIGCW